MTSIRDRAIRFLDRLGAYQPERGSIAGYLIAVVLMGLALLVRLEVAPLDAGLPYVAFFPAVVLSALIGGFGPGMFSVLAGIGLATFIFVPPYYTISLRALHAAFWSNMVFLVDGVIVCSLVMAMQRYQARLAAMVESLQLANLHDSQKDLRHAQAIGRIGSWRLDIRHNELHWSDETYNIFGIPRGTPLTYEIFLSAIHPEDRDYVDRMWQAALRGEPYEIEHRIVAKGEIKHIHETARLEFDEQGGLLGGFGTAQDITRYRQRELEHQEILQSTSEGFWLCDTTGRIMDVNDSYCRMSGYTREELLAMRIPDVEANESPEDVARHVQQVLLTGHDIFETRHRCKNGELIDLEINVSLSTVRGNTFVTFVRDISARKRMEQAVNKASLEIEDLYNNAPCGYHSLDRQGILTRINQTELDWLGYRRDEVIGKNISIFQTPSSAAVFARNYPRFMRNGYIRNIEVEMIKKDGTILPVLLSANAVEDANGDFVMSRTTLVDITDRKKMEAALIDSETRFRQLFEKAPIGIAMTGQDQKIFAANAAYCKMFGYSLEELRDLTITGLTHPDYIDMTRKLATEVLTGDVPIYSFEKKYLRKDGGTFWGHIIATGILGHDGKTRYVIGMIEDITERMALEEQRLTEVRTQRDTLVREVHHRIKNNLQGVVGLLRQHATDHPEMADTIEVVIGRIYSIAIIHGLQARTLSEEVDLGSLMKSIIDASGYFMRHEDSLQHLVRLNREETVPVALVLNELLTNACKHRSANTTATVRLETNGNDTLITIANHFDADRPATTDGGQGLSLVKSLLPGKSANLILMRAGNIYTAQLKLSPPVVLSGPEPEQRV